MSEIVLRNVNWKLILVFIIRIIKLKSFRTNSFANKLTKCLLDVDSEFQFYRLQQQINLRKIIQTYLASEKT